MNRVSFPEKLSHIVSQRSVQFSHESDKMILLLLSLVSTVSSQHWPHARATRTRIADKPKNPTSEIIRSDSIDVVIQDQQTLTISGGRYKIEGTNAEGDWNSNVRFIIQNTASISDKQGANGILLSGTNAQENKINLLEKKANTRLILEDFNDLELTYSSRDFPMIAVQGDSFVRFSTSSNDIVFDSFDINNLAECNISTDKDVTIKKMVLKGYFGNEETGKKVLIENMEVRDVSTTRNIDFGESFDLFRTNISMENCRLTESTTIAIMLSLDYEPAIRITEMDEFYCKKLEVNSKDNIEEFVLIDGFNNESDFSIDDIAENIWFYPATDENEHSYYGYPNDDNTALMVGPEIPEPTPVWMIVTVVLACCLGVFLVYLFVYRRNDNVDKSSIPIKNDSSLNQEDD